MNFEKASIAIKELLSTQLPSDLYYHNYDHTIYVFNAAVEFAVAENVVDEKLLIYLKTAALLHDSGFIISYDIEVEEEACKLAAELLPQFGYQLQDIEEINKMIMKTKMPQMPETLLEKILCDADLSYLGTNEFEEIANRLKREMEAHQKPIADWNNLQTRFLESHKYWTNSARRLRDKTKQQNLEKLKG